MTSHCKIKEISVNPCQNGGECSQSLDGRLTCNCAPDFNGTWCEQTTMASHVAKLHKRDLDPCQSVTCSNHGVCSPQSQTGFVCICNGNY